MSLRTRYLGFDLPHPLTVGACPLGDCLDTVRRLEDAGAAMITLRSLFAEQVEYNEGEAESEFFTDSVLNIHRMKSGGDDFALHPHEYLEHVRRVRKALDEKVPVVASMNVLGLNSWLDYVRLLDEAGANALELNIYSLVGDADRTGEAVEADLVEMVRTVKREATIPLAVKLLPYYTSLANVARRLAEAGADAVILFNRLYQPQIDIEQQSEQPMLRLSEQSDLLPVLRWLGILHGRVGADLAASGGVHFAEDAIAAVMCGATTVQLVSVLLKRGPEHLGTMRDNMSRWLDAHGHASLDAVRGATSLQTFPDPSAFERGFYMHMLQTWHGS